MLFSSEAADALARERHFAEYGAGNAPAQGTFDPIDEFHDLDFAGDDGVQRPFSTFMHGEFSGIPDASRRQPSETPEVDLREHRKQWNRAHLIHGQHDAIRRRAPSFTSPGRRSEGRACAF
jgi:hypothetical protein